MLLNVFGEIALRQWLATAGVRDNVILHECIIMPNHIHGIIEIVFQKESNNNPGTFNSPSQTIGSIVRGFKIATIKEIKEAISRMEKDKENSVLNNKRENRDIGNEVGGNKSEKVVENTSYSKVIGKGERKGDAKGELQFAPTAPTVYRPKKSLQFFS